MKNLKKISAGILLLSFVFATPLSADTLPIAGQTYTLAGSGVSSSATSFTLQSFKLPQTGQKIQTADLGDIFYVTLEPGTNRQEIVGCTIVTQNSNNTATLSNCGRGYSPINPYTASTTLRFTHGGGTQVVFSNPPQFQNQYTAKANDETITGSWSLPVPLSNTNPATKGYVDALVSGGSVVNSAVVVPGVAGETISVGQVLYLKQSDARWYKASIAIPEASSTVLGIAEGAGTSGVSISPGILLQGLDTNQLGLSAGLNYFLSSAAGTPGAATTTRYVGRARSSSSIYFDTFSSSANYPTLSGANAFTGTNTFTAPTVLSNIATSSAVATTTVGTPGVPILDIGKNTQIFTSSGTFAVPKGITKIYVRILGGGGSSGNDESGVHGTNGGGGAGGYVEGFFDVSATTSIGVIINSVSSGVGGTVFLSSMASSTGGARGSNSSAGPTSAAGGTGGVGHVLSTFAATTIVGAGAPGGSGSSITNGATFGGTGASSLFGGGGVGAISGAGTNAAGFGAGGGGSVGSSPGAGVGTNGLVQIIY